jgi:hypothetical protein
LKKQQYVVAVLLAGFAGICKGAEISSLQSTPTWNERGELVVTLTNWSKLTMLVDNVTATLSDDSGKPCQWTHKKNLKVGPTQKQTVVIADKDAVRACLRERKSFENVAPASLRFSSTPTDAEPVAVPGASMVTINAEVTRGKRSLRATSAWSLARVKQKGE